MNNRENVQFASGGLKCSGWLYRARGGPRPCVVLAHGFGGTREMRLGAYAEAFVEAGYHALVFDYRHFGDSEGEPRQILDIKRQHEDWRAALRFARGIGGVDPEKMILWGTSSPERGRNGPGSGPSPERPPGAGGLARSDACGASPKPLLPARRRPAGRSRGHDDARGRRGGEAALPGKLRA
ncbi:MAG: Alpha/beta hydrolase family protein [Deltaproteobacteria bacterium ADurb.BinA179]|nr:MAG: Alpha/beta hydrolase family protein [Deltaproteobacteria bacterium ADurb.BinA179]